MFNSSGSNSNTTEASGKAAKASHLLSFLTPTQEEVSQIQHSENYICQGEGKSMMRKIYQKVEYKPFEKQQIKLFKEQIVAHNQKHKDSQIIVPEHFLESDYLKILYGSHFNLKKSVENLQLNIQWRSDPQYHTMSPEVEGFLKNGMIYLSGRDNQLRPIIVLDALKLQLKGKNNNLEVLKQQMLNAICYFLNQIRKAMFVPGFIENWIFFIDTQKQGITSLPANMLGQIIKILQLNYGGCLHQLVILNPSGGLNFGWSFIKVFIDEETNRKIKFMTPKEYHKLQKFIDKKNIEQKYAGDLANVEQFWPISETKFYEIKPTSKNSCDEVIEKKEIQKQENQFHHSLDESCNFGFQDILEGDYDNNKSYNISGFQSQDSTYILYYLTPKAKIYSKQQPIKQMTTQSTTTTSYSSKSGKGITAQSEQQKQQISNIA